MDSGYFTLAIQNISNHKTDLNSLNGLSGNAAGIHKESVKLLTANITYMISLQDDLQANTNTMHTHLQDALSFLNENNREAVLVSIHKTHEIAVRFDKRLDDATAYTLSLKKDVIQFSQEANKVLKQLEKQEQQLAVEAQKAKDKADKYKKERYYFLALGPFGLAGLATATGLFTSWTNKSKNASKKVKNKRNEIKQVKDLQEAILELQDSYGFSLEVLSNVKNVLVFLTSDINNVMNNINNSTEENTVLALYLNASVKQLEVMQVEIS